MKAGRTTKKGLVERAIRRWLARGAVPRLPSVRVLARQFNTTPTTVSATIDTLAAEGLVTIVPRSGTYSTAALERVPDPKEVKPGSVERLVNKLRERIAHGRYPSGTTLPKVAWLCRDEGVTARTVQKSFERLREEGLISRRGRSHVVGLTPATNNETVAPLEAGVVLVVQWVEGDWMEVATAPRTRSFVEAFMRETAGRGYEIQPVVIEKEGNVRGLPAGLVEVAKLVRSLGPRYAGALVVAQPAGCNGNIPHLGSFYGWLGMLATLNKPVIWFDTENDPGDEARFEDLLRHKAVRRRFVRCRIDEKAGAARALKELALAGHKVVGYLGSPNKDDAEAELGRALLKMGLAIEPQVVVHGTDTRGWGPLFSNESPMREVRRRLSSVTFPGQEGVLAYLDTITPHDVPLKDVSPKVRSIINVTQQIGPLLARRPDISAIIAPTDHAAHDLCEWMMIAGIEFPREMTVITFDARYHVIYPHSVSSIDYGLDLLGYQAFHAVVRDVPVRPDKYRSLAGRCRINHLGSIAAPRPYILR
ncbi:MAG: GntR family transcriptional regulator [Chitinivibrionales bacterium]|nr:GntR family transcriptional regulator [Chitinivibrionales bacterium]MBD3355624.1 GntR family transcriptional regulator [Chitinivibrionales bacterium]